MRRNLIFLCQILIMSPLLPIYFLRTGLQACVDFLDWTTVGRAWCQPFFDAVEWVDRKYSRPTDGKAQQ